MENEYDYVYRRLEDDSRSIAKIAEDAKIGRSWLEKFARRDIGNPGYWSVFHLFQYYKRRRK